MYKQPLLLGLFSAPFRCRSEHWAALLELWAAPAQTPGWQQLLCRVQLCDQGRDPEPGTAQTCSLSPPHLLRSRCRGQCLTLPSPTAGICYLQSKKSKLQLSGQNPQSPGSGAPAVGTRGRLAPSLPQGSSGNPLVPRSLCSRSPRDKLRAGQKLSAPRQSLLSAHQLQEKENSCPGSIQTVPQESPESASGFSTRCTPSPCPRRILLLHISAPAGHTVPAPKAPAGVLHYHAATWAPFSPCLIPVWRSRVTEREQRHSKGPRRRLPAQQHSPGTQHPCQGSLILYLISWPSQALCSLLKGPVLKTELLFPSPPKGSCCQAAARTLVPEHIGH